MKTGEILKRVAKGTGMAGFVALNVAAILPHTANSEAHTVVRTTLAQIEQNPGKYEKPGVTVQVDGYLKNTSVAFKGYKDNKDHWHSGPVKISYNFYSGPDRSGKFVPVVQTVADNTPYSIYLNGPEQVNGTVRSVHNRPQIQAKEIYSVFTR